MLNYPKTKAQAAKYRYNKWAGNSRGWAFDPSRCAMEVMERGGGMMFYQFVLQTACKASGAEGSEMKYWVGVPRDGGTNKVFCLVSDPEPEDFPAFAYVVGPFDDKKDAESKAKTERNTDGMFRPFPGDPR